MGDLTRFVFPYEIGIAYLFRLRPLLDAPTGSTNHGGLSRKGRTTMAVDQSGHFWGHVKTALAWLSSATGMLHRRMFAAPGRRPVRALATVVERYIALVAHCAGGVGIHSSPTRACLRCSGVEGLHRGALVPLGTHHSEWRARGASHIPPIVVAWSRVGWSLKFLGWRLFTDSR